MMKHFCHTKIVDLDRGLWPTNLKTYAMFLTIRGGALISHIQIPFDEAFPFIPYITAELVTLTVTSDLRIWKL